MVSKGKVKKKETRNTNFEILRSVSMLLIISWHFILYGIDNTNFYLSTPVETFNYTYLEFSRVISSVAVNTYILITGYFLSTKTFKSVRILRTYIQLAFYAIIIFLFVCLWGNNSFSWKTLLLCLKLDQKTYWFVTNYLGLLIIAPFLSKAIQGLNQRTYNRLLIALIVLSTSWIAGFPFGNLFKFDWGYSLFWFIVLFLTGGYIKKFDFSIGKRVGTDLLIGCAILTIFYMMIAYLKARFTPPYILSDIRYNGLPFFLSIIIFSYFKQKKIAQNAFNHFMIWAAPYTFGVYLIHDNEYIRNVIWKELVDYSFFTDSPWLVFIHLGVISFTFIICILIDYMRKRIFDLLNINKLELYLSDYIDNWIKCKI